MSRWGVACSASLNGKSRPNPSPGPTPNTGCGCAAQGRLTTLLLSSGRTSASTSLMPRRFATARADVQLSPVSMTTETPSSRSARSAPGVDSLIVSATAMRPASREIDAILAAAFAQAAEMQGAHPQAKTNR